MTPSCRPSLSELKAAYARGENITHLLRGSGQINDQQAIAIAYDLQAGSYVAALRDEAARRYLDEYTAELAGVLRALAPHSLLEAGVGEATTLLATLAALGPVAPKAALGFDLSWSRVQIARQYWTEHGSQAVELFVGELEAIPLADSCVDVVFTSHAVEPNHGRERGILDELYRVTARYLVLLEPAYEFAGAEARARMEAHGYCRGLCAIAEERGWRVCEHRLFGVSRNPLNPTGLLVIEKAGGIAPATAPGYACPMCKRRLVLAHGHYFCAEEGLVFPVLRGIPCLLRSQAILASHFLD